MVVPNFNNNNDADDANSGQRPRKIAIKVSELSEEEKAKKAAFKANLEAMLNKPKPKAVSSQSHFVQKRGLISHEELVQEKLSIPVMKRSRAAKTR